MSIFVIVLSANENIIRRVSFCHEAHIFDLIYTLDYSYIAYQKIAQFFSQDTISEIKVQLAANVWAYVTKTSFDLVIPGRQTLFTARTSTKHLKYSFDCLAKMLHEIYSAYPVVKTS